MEPTSEKNGGGASRRRKFRILYLILGIAVVVGGGLGILNLVAGKADGASGGAEAGAEATENGEGAEEQDEKKAVPVEVTPVTTGRISSYLTASANLVAEYEVKVLSEVEGRVLKVFVEEGDVVRQGQALATLVRDDAEIGLNKARLKETNARLAYERGEDLAGKDLISREDLDKFTMDFEIARQELAEAQWQLEKTTIRAPIGGRLSQRLTQPGQHVRPGDEMFQVTDLDPMIARIYLPERDVLGLDRGRDVRIRLAADESVVFAGRIRQISPVVDTTTGTIKLTIEAVAPPAPVRPGSFVTISVVRETRPDTLLLPREAVLRELQSAHVFVVEDEVAKKRQVTLGLEEGKLVEALDGVAVGERVIVAGQGGLKDGAAIKVLETEAAAEAG